VELYFHSPIRLHGVVLDLKHRDIFNFASNDRIDMPDEHSSYFMHVFVPLA